MWTLIRDSLATAGLKAKYQRLIHERLLHFTEATGPKGVEEDPGRWLAVGRTERGLDEHQRSDARARARRLVQTNPHARNILRLLEVYVAGPGLEVTHLPADPGGRTPENDALLQTADRLWSRFLDVNERHYSAREHSRRAWRDGECFLRKFESPAWPPVVRFVDPETIGETPHSPGTEGILTSPDDVETPIAYLRLLDGGRGAERIDADDMLHTRVGVDSNQKRGVTIFAPVLDTLTCFDKWVDTELTARKLQSSIVLWRKVQGTPQQAAGLAEGASGGMGREAIRPGTILTTNQSTEVQFLQPNTNFGDAVPLGRMLLLNVAAGAGLPEFMLTSDASNANFASTMVAEGPAVKLFQSEQQFFAGEFHRLWRWIMTDAVELGLLPADFFERVTPRWTFPQLVNRDRTRERLADVRLVESQVLSRAEVARRDGVDPKTMREELQAEQSKDGSLSR
ncbi:Phage portal protein, lambda family [Caulifigura coniformis]|uniref:Phage portal protein, lambda family n=1 Tax=Caulifigura coniformis TaxID=2527983 RepID=A0A517S7D9_9PLAN|nr:phage portal protein [Caulifigura coniformis]QDT52051.1 Phage portal protein, lambda family [Caulifigura coniformis]